MKPCAAAHSEILPPIPGASALTGPGHGSDPAGMETTAEKVSGGYRIRGSKFWITHAPIADVIIVWAKAPEGVRAFLVERDRPGSSSVTLYVVR